MIMKSGVERFVGYQEAQGRLQRGGEQPLGLLPIEESTNNLELHLLK